MSHAYLGFVVDLRRALNQMKPLAQEYGDDWLAAAAVVPGLDVKVRDQLATEHLVRCFRLENGEDYVPSLPQKGRPHIPKDKRRTGRQMLADLGVTHGDVRAWAVHQGLIKALKRGPVGNDVIELYALAHEKPDAVERSG